MILAIAAGILIVACERNFLNPPANNLTRNQLYSLMKEFYLWYDEMPVVNPGDYSSLTELLNALQYKPTDRWSYVTSTAEFESYYRDGEYIGHGFGMKWDSEGKLRISFTYDGTSAQSQGLERGWELLGINGETITVESDLDSLLGADSIGVENTFSFLNKSGQSINLTLTKETIDINAVLHAEVIELDTSTVGYVVYQQFLSPSLTELDAVFSDFIDAGIDDIVVDLRYNGGGQVDVAQHLGSLIAGEFAVKRIFVQFEYNDKNTERERSYPFQEPEYMLTPTPERVFFITTRGSASASEMLINSLVGLSGTQRTFEVYLVGDDTHGKPVGSIARPYNDSTLVPITFKYTNRLGNGDFFDGLPADSYIEEDLTIDFGDPEEKLLKEVLYFIENGEFTGAGKKKSVPGPALQLKGIHTEIGAI